MTILYFTVWVVFRFIVLELPKQIGFKLVLMFRTASCCQIGSLNCISLDKVPLKCLLFHHNDLCKIIEWYVTCVRIWRVELTLWIQYVPVFQISPLHLCCILNPPFHSSWARFISYFVSDTPILIYLTFEFYNMNASTLYIGLISTNENAIWFHGKLWVWRFQKWLLIHRWTAQLVERDTVNELPTAGIRLVCGLSVHLLMLKRRPSWKLFLHKWSCTVLLCTIC